MNLSPSNSKPEMSKIREKVRRRIQSSHRYKIGRYDYFVWPYKGLMAIDPEELSYLIRSLSELIPSHTQTILTFMTDGDILAVPLGQITRLPVIVCRECDYRMRAPLSFIQKTGYYSRSLYCAVPDRNKPICVVDAIISTGASMVAAGKALQKYGCTITGAVAAIEKVSRGGRTRIKNELGITPRVLFRAYRDDANVFHVRKYNT